MHTAVHIDTVTLSKSVAEWPLTMKQDNQPLTYNMLITLLSALLQIE